MARKSQSRRRPLRRLVATLVFLAVAAGAGYAGFAWLKLKASLASAGPGVRSTRLYLASAKDGPVKTSLPFVLKAAVKREDAQDWLSDGDRGLVEKRFAWDPSAWSWTEDPAPALPLDERSKLQVLSVNPLLPQVIDALADKDAHRREVAGRALRMRTGQDLGYRFDGSEASRAKAIEAWRKWWDENKVKWGKEQIDRIFGGGEPAAGK